MAAAALLVLTLEELAALLPKSGLVMVVAAMLLCASAAGYRIGAKRQRVVADPPPLPAVAPASSPDADLADGADLPSNVVALFAPRPDRDREFCACLLPTFADFPTYVGLINHQLESVTTLTNEAAETLMRQLLDVDARLASLLDFIRNSSFSSRIDEVMGGIERHLATCQDLLAEISRRERQDSEMARAYSTSVAEESRAVLGMIEGVHRIARQTSMLSFNVSIEAARVGDAGLGFTVIGSEIRTLAGEVQTLANNLHERLGSFMGAIGADLLSQTESRAARQNETIAGISDFLGGLSAKLGPILHEEIVSRHGEILNRVAEENERIATPIMTMMGSIQFQDIVRQKIEQLVRMTSVVGDHMAAVGEVVATEGEASPPPSLGETLDSLSSGYVMEDQRRTHRLVHGRSGAAGEATAAAIELF
jgi:hypothetical protein